MSKTGAPIVTPCKLVQSLAKRYGTEISELGLPETAILAPVYPLFRKLVHTLNGRPLATWGWKFPPLHEVDIREGETCVLACCPPGASNVAIALEELRAFGVRTLYFFGLAGGMGNGVGPGDLILPPYAHVGEGTTRYYGNMPLSFADRELLEKVKGGLGRELGESLGACPIWTTDALYRELPGDVEKFSRMGVCGVDMEVSAVFSVARVLSMRAVALVWISDLLTEEGWEQHFYNPDLTWALNNHLMVFKKWLLLNEA